MKRNFLVVAANAQVREALASGLRAAGFAVTRAANGAEAERVAGSISLDAVLVESHLPDMSVEELRERLKRLRPDCPVAAVSSFDHIKNSPEQLKYGANDYLLNLEQLLPLVTAPFDGRDVSGDSFTQRGHDALVGVVDVLVGILEMEDKYFGGTSHRAMTLARQVTEELGADSQTVQEVVLATLLKDVGRITVAPEVLTEPGPLTEEQKKSMQDHVQASTRLFEHIDFPWKVLPIVRHHHERYDGTGYPDGLRGREIPMGARVVAVVDAFVALTSKRTHRAALDAEAALQRLIGHAGRQFDPEVVEAFQKVIDKRFETKHPGAKRTALIADAQKDFRRLLKMRLINEGFEVQEAKNCAAALKVMLKDRPDIALLDMDADPDEAFGTLAEMRGDTTLCRLPLVFLTRSTDRVQKLRALREGVDDYIHKDEDVETLVARVENILNRESLRREGTAQVRRGISGDLENLSLPDIVQTLAMGMKSAQVTVTSGGERGSIWFENGAAIHCSTDDEEGEQAFYKLVSWTEGEFVIEHGVKAKSSTLNGDTMFLLMEGMRRLDEQVDASRQAVS